MDLRKNLKEYWSDEKHNAEHILPKFSPYYNGKNLLFFLIFLSAKFTNFWGFTTIFRGFYRQLNTAYITIITITGLSLQSQMELRI